MSGAYTEAVLNKLSKPDFVQIILNAKANLGLRIAKLITEVKDLLAYSKKLEAAVASVRNVNSKLVEMIVPSVSVVKMANTRGEICWRWLEYQCLLGTISLSRRFVMCFRKLAWIYVIVTLRPVIALRIKAKRLLNLPTEKFVFEFWE